MIGATRLRAIRAALFGMVVTLVALPIMGLPYSADDTFNRNQALQPFLDQVRGAWDINLAWMRNQGRFFPGGSLYGLIVWNALPSRAAYMTYLVLLNIVCVVLVSYVVWQVARSPYLAAFAGFAVGMCMQLRYVSFDGLASFTGLVQYTLTLTLIAGLAAGHICRGGSRWWSLAVLVPWSLAITAYEVSLLMLPAILLLIWAIGPPIRENWRRWSWATLPLLVPAALEFGVTMVLRQDPKSVVPAYQIDLGGPVLATMAKQFTAALPFAQSILIDAPFDWRLGLMLVAALAVPTILAWRPWAAGPPSCRRRTSYALIGAGAWAWLTPSLLAGVTVRWQESLDWGVGYIYLPYEFVGLALVLTGIAGIVRSYAPAPWARVAFSVLFGIVVVACVLTAAENILNVGTIVPGPAGPG